jgi:uncharacterized BrkB/YihY/UPF0761 family membrane protein
MRIEARATARAVHLRYRVHGLNDVAAGLSFWTFLSIFPSLIAVASVLGQLEVVIGATRAEQLRDRIRELLERYLTGEYANDLTAQALDILDYHNPQLAAVAVAAALFSMSKGFAGLCRALALVNGDPGRRRGWRGRAVGLALGAVTLALFLVVLAQATFGPLFGFESYVPDAAGVVYDLWQIARVPVLALVLLAWTAVLLHAGPGIRARWRSVIPGAAVATVLWAGATVGMAVALRIGVIAVNPVFGVLGAVVLLLTWLNLMSTGILIGGEVNAHRLGRPLGHGHPLDPPVAAVEPTDGAAPTPVVPGETFTAWLARLARSVGRGGPTRPDDRP